jgi:hypothetical protein
MGVDAAIARFRRRQEGLFTEEVEVRRPAGEGAFDPDTGLHEGAVPGAVYEGPALVRSFSWEGTDVQTGEREVRLRGARAKFPHDTAVRKDDVVVVTSSRHDGGLAGRRYRITDVLHDGWQIVRVAVLEEATGTPGTEQEVAG